MLSASIKRFLSLVRKPLIKRMLTILPEDKVLGGLGNVVVQVCPQHADKIVAVLNYIQDIKPEGGLRALLQDEVVLNEIEEFISDLESVNNSEGDNNEKTSSY